MDNRIQFRVDEKVKALAQQFVESQNSTISDMCRELVEHLAEKQLQTQSHEKWVTEQVDKAFNKLERGEAKFLSQDVVDARMAALKQRLSLECK